MQAKEAELLEFLKNTEQFIIPIYQRNYSWDLIHCEKLFSDILNAGKDQNISAHFIGSIVYTIQSTYQVSGSNPLLVIDGQQRLTTIILLLEALGRVIGEDKIIDKFSQQYIRDNLVCNEKKGKDTFKILLSKQDKDILIALLTDNLQTESGHRIIDNFYYFEDKIKQLNKEGLINFCHGLLKLIIIDVSLEQGKDNPQLIFESMNSTGKALSQADLVRNYILMGLEVDEQSKLYNQYWLPMEKNFGEKWEVFNAFLRHYLTLKTLNIPKLDDVYEEFKKYASGKNINDLVEEIFIFSGYFSAIALKKEKSKILANAFQSLRDLKVDVAYPFLLEAYHYYKTNAISEQDLESLIKLVESYIFRRSVCEIPTNSLNKTFVGLINKAEPNNYLERIKVEFYLLSGYRRFPNDDEFLEKLKTRDLYNFRNKNYFFKCFENNGRKERVNVEEYSIEHILPQNEKLNAEWINTLGENWKEVQNKYLHTLGNLTLTGYNSEYSDRSYREKRTMENGFLDSPLRLNKELKHIEVWNEDSIKQRASALAEKCVSIWNKDIISDEIINKYKPVAENLYSEELHLADKSIEIKELFNKMKLEILSLDSNIIMESLKLYIAFKAETNFVDVIIKKSKLVLILNMPFELLSDPKGIARDITNIGSWGNGTVQIEFKQDQDFNESFPYVFGLIKQSLNYQLGNG